MTLVVFFLAAFDVFAAEQAPKKDSPDQTSVLAEAPTAAAQQDRDRCQKNLLRLSAAIQAYRKDHNQLRNWLSDLVPLYLTATNRIICPVCVRTGARPPGMPDPKVQNAYHYELIPSPIGGDVPSFWGATPITMREWKQQQERIAGADIPFVRCFMHGSNSLDLTLRGKVREDPLIWELGFTNAAIKLRDLAPYPVTKPGPAQEL